MAIDVNELLSLSETELKRIADEHNIPGKSQMNKIELIDSLFIDSLIADDEKSENSPLQLESKSTTNEVPLEKNRTSKQGNKPFISKSQNSEEEPWEKLTLSLGGLFASLVYIGLSDLSNE